ncbi:MAG: PilZ domain-containing protein [Nitrospiria bacterium]
MLPSAKKAGTKNNRVHQRTPFIVLEVKGKHSNEVFLASAENLGPGGLFLSSPKKLKVGGRFPIEFVLPDMKTKIFCTCEVVWKKSYDNLGLASEGIGVRFVDMDPAQKKIISDWVDKKHAKSRRP